MNQVPLRHRTLRRLVTGWVDLIYPPTCLHCHVPRGAGSSDIFCDTCLPQLLALLGDACPHCAASVAEFAVRDDRCPYCRTESYKFAQAFAWGGYHSVLKPLILRMKHASGEP